MRHQVDVLDSVALGYGDAGPAPFELDLLTAADLLVDGSEAQAQLLHVPRVVLQGEEVPGGGGGGGEG